MSCLSHRRRESRMSARARASSAPGSAPGSARPERALDSMDSSVAVLNVQGPVDSSRSQPSPNQHHLIPHELFVSLTSTVHSKNAAGHTAHQHWEGCGLRRPDAVWHHPLGRKKYKYFLEQPTSLTGAGRDISFLCDALVTQKKTTRLPPVTEKDSIKDKQNLSLSESLIPDEYRMVKNEGIRTLEFYEDAFTVQLKDDEQKLRVLPSLRPSGRLEVVQLMRLMDDMLEKAGVDQQSEELTELSQLEGLLELVKVEQNIYNIVFHELIRQVSVECAERGQLLAKLRQRYQALLDRIPRRLKALHTEAVAQRSLNRRLTEEIHRIKTSIQQLNMELSRIREHDAFVFQQAEHAHRQLAESLKQTDTNSHVVQGYHELYELQRTRLETQLLQMTEDRDCWSQLTFCLALEVISTKKLQLFSQLHMSEQSWFKTAEHCILFLVSKDTEDLDGVMKLADYWRKKLTDFVSELKKREEVQSAQISTVQQGINKWLSLYATRNECPNSKSDENALEEIHCDLQKWSGILALLCEHYQGEQQLCGQQTLGELAAVQEKWMTMSFQLFKRHCSPDGELPGGHLALKELDSVLSELLQQLDTQMSGENGIHGKLTALIGEMKSLISETGSAIGKTKKKSASEWLNLEKALNDCQRLSEEALQQISIMQPENNTDKKKPDIHSETEKALDKVQEFKTNLSNFTEGENHRLSEQVNSIHMGQTRWMLDLLLLMVADRSEEQTEEEGHHYMKRITLQTVDDDAKILTEKLDRLSGYITSSCNLILEERVTLHPSTDDSENVINECSTLQTECMNWVETCKLLLSGVSRGPVERFLKQPELIGPAGNMAALLREEALAEQHDSDSEAKGVEYETEVELKQGEPSFCDSLFVKQIGYDGSITERKLEESSVHLNGVDELLVSPVTEAAQKAFSDLTTIALLQQELHDSEVRVRIAEQRALTAEEALQAALEKIQDLERQLHSRPGTDPKSNEERDKTPPPSPPTATTPAPPKKSSAEAKPMSSSKKTRKR